MSKVAYSNTWIKHSKCVFNVLILYCKNEIDIITKNIKISWTITFMNFINVIIFQIFLEKHHR